ncbi:MAG TPA: L,D-transpeptidase family protein [Firmicutes bacterium]|nr:L,D-transpeptidase family protein [Bacillota bacterium]
MKYVQAAVLVLAVILALNNVAAAEVSGRPTAPCGCEPVRVLRVTVPQMYGTDVTGLQQRLTKLGFYQGPLSGVYDRETARAVARLQAFLGLASTGVVDERTWEALAFYEAKPAVESPPPEGEITLRVDIDAQTLVVYTDGKPYKLYPVAVGKQSSPTPLGEWVVTEKIAGWHGATGVRWMRLSNPWGSYGIHGTNNPSSIGQMASAGCVRMFNHDVIELYEWVEIGTLVTLKGHGPYGPVRPVIEQGAVGQDVVFLQWRLRELGFDPGRADGVCGAATEKALAAWQRYRGLPVTGKTDRDVLYLLGLW